MLRRADVGSNIRLPHMSSTRKPAARRTVVSRAEFDEARGTLEDNGRMLRELQHTAAIQFERIAQMQAQLDALQRSLERLTAPRVPPRAVPPTKGDGVRRRGTAD